MIEVIRMGECLSCLEEIKKEGIIYGLVIKDIDEILSKERITSQDVMELTGKLKKYDSDLPITKLAFLASTQLLEYKKKLEDTNRPMDLIKEELKDI
jgi:hypothetical protein